MVYVSKALVLHCIPFQEHSLICKILTKDLGMVSFILKNVRAKSKNKQPLNLCQPGMFLQIEFNYYPLKNLQYLKSFNQYICYKTLFNNIVKTSILLYIIEIINKTIIHPEKNDLLFNFIENFIRMLDEGNNQFTTNLPIYFLIQFAQLLGIGVEKLAEASASNFKDNFSMEFNEEVGKYGNKYPQTKKDIFDFSYISEIVKSSMNIQQFTALKISKDNRQLLFNFFHHHYSLHGKSLNNLKTYNVIKQIL